jgi:hypothetical protein
VFAAFLPLIIIFALFTGVMIASRRERPRIAFNTDSSVVAMAMQPRRHLATLFGPAGAFGMLVPFLLFFVFSTIEGVPFGHEIRTHPLALAFICSVMLVGAVHGHGEIVMVMAFPGPANLPKRTLFRFAIPLHARSSG